jgi:hypothetical protein
MRTQLSQNVFGVWTPRVQRTRPLTPMTGKTMPGSGKSLRVRPRKLDDKSLF